MSRHTSQSHRAKGPTQRQLRVGEMLRHALVEILQKGHMRDPDLAGKSVTVTEVRPSPDLRKATVYCLSLGSENDDLVVAALNRSAKYLRGQLGHAITLKFTPELSFKTDTAFGEAAAMDALLHSPRVIKDLDGAQDASGDAVATSGKSDGAAS